MLHPDNRGKVSTLCSDSLQLTERVTVCRFLPYLDPKLRMISTGKIRTRPFSDVGTKKDDFEESVST